MTGKAWSDFVNVHNEVYNWYMKFDWYTRPYTAYFYILTVKVYIGSYRDIGMCFGIWKTMTIFIGMHDLYGFVVYVLQSFLMWQDRKLDMSGHVLKIPKNSEL